MKVKTRVKATRTPRFSLAPDVRRRVGEIVFRWLEKQARRGLAPAKRGGVVDLHHYAGHKRLWSEVEITEEGRLVFHAPTAFLLEQYGADTLRGEFLAGAEREISALLNGSGAITVEY